MLEPLLQAACKLEVGVEEAPTFGWIISPALTDSCQCFSNTLRSSGFDVYQKMHRMRSSCSTHHEVERLWTGLDFMVGCMSISTSSISDSFDNVAIFLNAAHQRPEHPPAHPWRGNVGHHPIRYFPCHCLVHPQKPLQSHKSNQLNLHSVYLSLRVSVII